VEPFAVLIQDGRTASASFRASTNVSPHKGKQSDAIKQAQKGRAGENVIGLPKIQNRPPRLDRTTRLALVTGHILDYYAISLMVISGDSQ
jgi:hypothetical protein